MSRPVQVHVDAAQRWHDAGAPVFFVGDTGPDGSRWVWQQYGYGSHPEVYEMFFWGFRDRSANHADGRESPWCNDDTEDKIRQRCALASNILADDLQAVAS